MNHSSWGAMTWGYKWFCLCQRDPMASLFVCPCFFGLCGWVEPKRGGCSSLPLSWCFIFSSWHTDHIYFPFRNEMSCHPMLSHCSPTAFLLFLSLYLTNLAFISGTRNGFSKSARCPLFQFLGHIWQCLRASFSSELMGCYQCHSGTQGSHMKNMSSRSSL